ncbi:DUF397 domain-containing protein [Allonocardiopsis opalescens]|uniref:Uncharacterized protein DUF397 n=1 Tax=Allonocardiopsis opalescens TaxID=1144618 RepID=A0A2T0QC87_9ACTN|nr:DUF397 domain-containing protein [Allonocardiopsis opalescens]PRY01566.1 uncharacterized protein DUF397 [Allonocardiopsis opalescens]
MTTGWRKSSYSNQEGGDCVEVKTGPGVLVRDSKNPDQPHLSFTVEQWSAFVATVKASD